MNYKLVISALAKAYLESLYYYIAEDRTADIANRHIKEIIAYCNNLCIFPLRGALREDLRAGMRITSYRKRVVIAFAVEGGTVTVLGIFYGGQDYEALLSADNP